MKSVDTHGLEIKGLRHACSDTFNYGDYSAAYTEIFYHRKTCKIWTKYQYSLGHNNWTEYDDPDILKVCETSRHMTMQEIADAVAKRMMEVWGNEV